ncbi:hypothetical protein [Chitinophaga dinghuensis]|uniref:hypothetical protein n=1 Tax=Chitinophaga dinghuensis TaxID=1539050 RepID=UPI0011B94315|nr:hypothetical protein [Chitinophaga dinghuensis]
MLLFIYTCFTKQQKYFFAVLLPMLLCEQKNPHRANYIHIFIYCCFAAYAALRAKNPHRANYIHIFIYCCFAAYAALRAKNPHRANYIHIFIYCCFAAYAALRAKKSASGKSI